MSRFWNVLGFHRRTLDSFFLHFSRVDLLLHRTPLDHFCTWKTSLRSPRFPRRTGFNSASRRRVSAGSASRSVELVEQVVVVAMTEEQSFVVEEMRSKTNWRMTEQMWMEVKWRQPRPKPANTVRRWSFGSCSSTGTPTGTCARLRCMR